MLSLVRCFLLNLEGSILDVLNQEALTQDALILDQPCLNVPYRDRHLRNFSRLLRCYLAIGQGLRPRLAFSLLASAAQPS